MSNEKSNLTKYEPLFGDWKVDSLIGEGNFSSVYKIKSYSNSTFSTVKFIRIPNSNLYSNAINNLGSKKRKLNLYFSDLISNIEHYINILSNINDPYILKYQDHTIVKLTGKTGWDFLIKMERLDSMENFMKFNEFTLRDLLLMSIDVCVGLSRYRLKDIYQTNIYENNIFLSESGTYKIGDFSLNTHIKRNIWPNSFLSGPFNLSPELFSGKTVDETSDIYSLGMFLYKMLNNGRYPFLPDYPTEITESDIKSATKQRLKGEIFPIPVNSPEVLSKLIVKCCSFKRSERFNDPMDLRKTFEKYLSSLTEDEKNKVIIYPSSYGNEDSNSEELSEDPERTIAYGEADIPKKYSMFIEDEFLQEKTYSDTFKMIQSHNFDLVKFKKIFNTTKRKIFTFLKINIFKKNK
ncbi:MAG: protein kinase [Clostridiales bacterium]